MPAYLLGSVTIEDEEGFAEYSKRVPETIARHGGRFLARGGRVEVLEGDWAPNRLVVLEFDSFEQAKRWYESDEYQDLAAIRLRCASTDLVLVEGLDA
jgi:uncharacterized protein (DUF1330 family)